MIYSENQYDFNFLKHTDTPFMAQNVAYPVNVPCIHRRIAGTFTAIVCSVKTNQVTVVDAVPVFPILLSLCLTLCSFHFV